MIDFVTFAAWGSLGIEGLGALIAYCELTTLFLDLKRGVFVYDLAAQKEKSRKRAERHTLEHMFVLLMTIIINFAFLGWLFGHLGFEHAWELHVKEEHLWAFIFIFGIYKILVTYHLRTERLDSYAFHYGFNPEK